MDISAPGGAWTFIAVFFAVMLLLQFAFEGFVYALGGAIVWLLSAGRIRVGERRSLRHPPPKLNGGTVFYYEDSNCYIYRNFAGLVGFVTVLVLLTAIYGVGFWANAH